MLIGTFGYTTFTVTREVKQPDGSFKDVEITFDIVNNPGKRGKSPRIQRNSV